MAQHHKRKGRATLNMVSLMDIFTILVFFLLVSSSTVQDLPSSKKIKLPESVADKLPKESVVVMVGDQDILVQGQKVASLDAVLRSKDDEIKELSEALFRQSKRIVVKKTPDGKPITHDITIMGDKEIPYQVLKKIMFTCSKANYGNISLAVLKKTPTDVNG
jgi:biopolymer transport protein ExbD